MPDVDVVIPTFNRQERLVRTLRSLQRQTVRPARVIVVDDCSTPPAEVAIPAGLRDELAVSVLRTERNSGPAAARNLAVRASTAEFVAFIDDDVDAAPEWLERLVAAIDVEEPCVVFGPLLAPADWRPTPWNDWEAHTLAREYDRMQRGIYEPTWRQFFTGNAIVRRADIVEAGGFNEHFTRAEDVELGRRLALRGCRFVFEPKAVGWHYARRSLASWLRIPREYGEFDAEIDRLYPELHWRRTVEREQAERPWPARAARRVLGNRVVRPGAVRVLVHGARGAYGVRLRSAALRALSVAYDLEYHAAFARASARTRNRASTGPQREAPTVTRGPHV